MNRYSLHIRKFRGLSRNEPLGCYVSETRCHSVLWNFGVVFTFESAVRGPLLSPFDVLGSNSGTKLWSILRRSYNCWPTSCAFKGFKMDDLFGDLPPPCNTTKALILYSSFVRWITAFGLCYFLSASGDDLLGNLYDDLPTSENSGENKRKLETTQDDNESPAKRILAGEEIILLQLLMNCRLYNVNAMQQIYWAQMCES